MKWSKRRRAGWLQKWSIGKIQSKPNQQKWTREKEIKEIIEEQSNEIWKTAMCE